MIARESVRQLSTLLAVTVAASLVTPFGVGAWRFVAALGAFLRDMRGEIAEFGPATGVYLELLFPSVRVCMDSRYVEAPTVRRYFAALIHPTAFRSLDGEHRFDGLLLKVVDSGPLVLELVRDPEWRLVWADLHRALWARGDGRGAPRWPDEGLHLDLGDDLSRRVNGMAAIQWTAILVQAGNRGLLLEGLDQLAGAPVIPSFVVQYALQYGLAHGDDEVIARARTMATRALALKPEHRQAVERLLAAAEARQRY